MFRVQLRGLRPFKAPQREQLLRNLLNRRSQVLLPKNLHRSTRLLQSALLLPLPVMTRWTRWKQFSRSRIQANLHQLELSQEKWRRSHKKRVIPGEMFAEILFKRSQSQARKKLRLRGLKLRQRFPQRNLSDPWQPTRCQPYLSRFLGWLIS